MELLTRIGKLVSGLALLFLLFLVPAHSQTSLVCKHTAVPHLVRLEGLTERMGDIQFDCSGGMPGTSFNGNLTFFLTVNVTNKLLANNTVDVPLTVDTGAGPVPANVPARLFSPNAIVCNELNIPAPPSGYVALRLTNLCSELNPVGQLWLLILFI